MDGVVHHNGTGTLLAVVDVNEAGTAGENIAESMNPAAGPVGRVVGTLAGEAENACEESPCAQAAATSANAVGKLGETIVKGLYNIGKKVKIRLPNGSARIPDGTIDGVSMSEMKNVQYQALTQQLQDFANYDQDNTLQLDLYVRKGNVLSGPLRDLIDGNAFVHLYRVMP